MEIDIQKAIRGMVDLDPTGLAELEILKKEVYGKKGKETDLKSEFEYKALLLSSGMPKVYWDIKWDDFVGDPQAKKLVHKYCEIIVEAFEAGQGIIFCGSHGTGKTALSTFVMKSAIEKGYTVRYLAVAKIIDMIMKSFDDRDYRERLFTMVERVELLVLDDLGKEYMGVKKQLNPMVSMTLDSMLRERVNRKLITVASTNFSPQIIKEQYGDSVWSILSSVGMFVNVTGEDFRLLKGKQFWGKVK